VARILLIEDNPTNLGLMVYLLQAFGHQTVEARDGHSGLALTRRERPDLILCDLQLSDIDGYAFAREIRADSGLTAVPLVAITTSATLADRAIAQEAGFHGYLTLPLIPEKFVAQVEVYLPEDKRSRSLQTDRQAAIASSGPPPRGTVLVVDDAPANVELLRAILEPSGYSVLVATGVAEALALARRSPPDLILSDPHRPGRHGFDLLRAAKSDPRLAGIPIIIHSTSVDSVQAQAQAMALGATRFIAIPIEPQVLLKVIASCVGLDCNSPAGARP
jgi:two-component system cell cycle response regulator